jgi:hypothetical protein
MVYVAQAYKVVRINKRAKENERAKEVEPDGHGEVIRDHELHLHELASVGSTMVVPIVLPLG